MRQPAYFSSNFPVPAALKPSPELRWWWKACGSLQFQHPQSPQGPMYSLPALAKGEGVKLRPAGVRGIWHQAIGCVRHAPQACQYIVHQSLGTALGDEILCPSRWPLGPSSQARHQNIIWCTWLKGMYLDGRLSGNRPHTTPQWRWCQASPSSLHSATSSSVSSSSPRSWWLWIYRGSQVTVQGKLYIGDAYDSPGWVQNYASHMVGPTASIGQDLECMEVLNTSNVCGQDRQPIVIGAGMEIAMVARHLVNHDGAHWSIQLIDVWH